MKIVQINLGNFGSTGNIAKNINKLAISKGNEAYFVYPYNGLNKPTESNDIIIGSKIGKFFDRKIGEITGYQGCFARKSTKKILCTLDRIKPDIIHLHNLHGGYINLSMLFSYIKSRRIRVVWTLHDCWAFTGQCPYFTMSKCEKWKVGCHHCNQINIYPKSYVDQTKNMWELKKKWFTGVEDMHIITPSHWLSDLANDSFLNDYDIRVINNGIDLDVFKSTISHFRKKYNIGSKYIVLGVADSWGKRKGLDVFLELGQMLPKTYQIVLVGTNDRIDQQLPENIISIHRTQNQHEMAEIYSAADVFANPTREENYPTVNMESLACGTPVVTFNTGGCSEIIDKTCGIVSPANDVNKFMNEIMKVCEEKTFLKEDCIKKAKSFDKNDRFQEYINLYEELIL